MVHKTEYELERKISEEERNEMEVVIKQCEEVTWRLEEAGRETKKDRENLDDHLK